jgi:hypothetical protein
VQKYGLTPVMTPVTVTKHPRNAGAFSLSKTPPGGTLVEN